MRFKWKSVNYWTVALIAEYTRHERTFIGKVLYYRRPF